MEILSEKQNSKQSCSDGIKDIIESLSSLDARKIRLIRCFIAGLKSKDRK